MVAMESSAAEARSSSSSSTVTRTALLVLRVLTSVFLVISLIFISFDKATEFFSSDNGIRIKFNDLLSYRYMLATIVIGLAYNLFQMALLIFNVVSGKRLISGDFVYHLEFFCDKTTAYLLATGAAAGFGASEDVHRAFTFLLFLPLDSFFNMANASAALLFVAFLFSAATSVFASYALPHNKRADQPLVDNTNTNNNNNNGQ